MVFSRSATFNTKSQLVADDSTTRKSDGTSYRAVSSYEYGSGADYALGSALTISTINYKGGRDADAPDTLTTNSYAWWDGAVQNGITHKPNTAQSTSYYTGFGYNDLGQLTRASIADGRQRTVTFRLNADGQILRRDEVDNVASTGDPHALACRLRGDPLTAIPRMPVRARIAVPVQRQATGQHRQ